MFVLSHLQLTTVLVQVAAVALVLVAVERLTALVEIALAVEHAAAVSLFLAQLGSSAIVVLVDVQHSELLILAAILGKLIASR